MDTCAAQQTIQDPEPSTMKHRSIAVFVKASGDDRAAVDWAAVDCIA